MMDGKVALMDISCVRCDWPKAPKMETVGDHEPWRKLHILYFFAILLVFCCLQVMDVGLLVLYGVPVLRSGVGDGA
jgi:hypothetical protein